MRGNKNSKVMDCAIRVGYSTMVRLRYVCFGNRQSCNAWCSCAQLSNARNAPKMWICFFCTIKHRGMIIFIF